MEKLTKKFKKMKVLSIICLVFLFSSCKENKASPLDFLVGPWKMEGKEQYEIWGKTKKMSLLEIHINL